MGKYGPQKSCILAYFAQLKNSCRSTYALIHVIPRRHRRNFLEVSCKKRLNFRRSSFKSLGLQHHSKKTSPPHSFSCTFYEMFQSSLCIGHLQNTASGAVNLFLADVPILYLLKRPEDLLCFRGYTMRPSARIG